MKHVLGRFIIFFITVYSLMLFIRILLSWINTPQYRWVYWLCKFTDPVIDFFRRNFPIRVSAIDLSIATPLLLLFILSILTTDFLVGDEPFKSILNIWYILTLIISVTKFLYNFVLFIFIFFVFILLIVNLLAANAQNPFISTIRSMLNPILNLLEKLFNIKSPYKESIYLIILLVFFIIIDIFGSSLLVYSYNISKALLEESKNQAMMLGFYFKTLV